MVTVVDYLGQRVLGCLVYAWDLLALVYLSFRTMLLNRAQGFRTVVSVVCSQIYFTGFQALPLISAIAFATGGIVVMQSTSQMSMLGGGGSLGQVLVIVVVREVGPLLTALIVIARSGTAVASEIGTMRANREIEALESMGINPLSFIVFPRLAGGIISVFCLAVYFLMASVLGGLVVARGLQGIPVGFYFGSIAQAFTQADVYLFCLKNLFSGTIIFTIACYQGFQVLHGPHEVPQVTTRAVVGSIISVIGFNMIVTTLYYLNQLMALGVL